MTSRRLSPKRSLPDILIIGTARNSPDPCSASFRILDLDKLSHMLKLWIDVVWSRHIQWRSRVVASNNTSVACIAISSRTDECRLPGRTGPHESAHVDATERAGDVALKPPPCTLCVKAVVSSTRQNDRLLRRPKFRKANSAFGRPAFFSSHSSQVLEVLSVETLH